MPRHSYELEWRPFDKPAWKHWSLRRADVCGYRYYALHTPLGYVSCVKRRVN
jgi:hypothetical protein